jgi:hypothetical protein
MNAIDGLPFGMVTVPLVSANDGSFGASIAMAPVSIATVAR